MDLGKSLFSLNQSGLAYENSISFLPDGLSPTELMERKLLTERGRKLYKIRGKTVEPVFGQIKDVRDFDRFMRRGIEACQSEWSLICATHNLLEAVAKRQGPLELRKRLYGKQRIEPSGPDSYRIQRLDLKIIVQQAHYNNLLKP